MAQAKSSTIAGTTYTSSRYTPIPATQSKVPVNMTVNPNAPATILKNASQNANLYKAPAAKTTTNPLSTILAGISKLISGSGGSQAASVLLSGGSSRPSSGSSVLDSFEDQPAQQTKIPTTGVANKLSTPIYDASGKAIQGAYTTKADGSYSAIPMTSLTSGVSDTTANSTQKVANDMRLSLQDITNDPFKSNGTKADLRTAKMEGVTNSFAKLFPSAESVDYAYNSHPGIKTALDEYIANGGSLEKIKANVQNQEPATYVIQPGDTLNGIASRTGKNVADLMAMNPNITDPNIIQAGESLNLGSKNQDTTSYLAELNNPQTKTPAELMNLPLEEQTQNEIMRQMGIPAQYKDLYFGTPEKIGILEAQKTDAEKKIELYEEKLRDKETDLRSKASATIDKYRAQQAVDDADIEAKRLQSKNYITGMLAKFGILTTSGQAPIAIAALDTKYDALKVQTDSKYTASIRDVEIALNSDISDEENSYADKEQAVREDLTKSTSDVTKELLKLRQDADSKIYSITSSYAKTLESAKTKYQNTLKANAKKYSQDYFDVFSQQERNKLEQAGLKNADRKSQFDYLYKPKSDREI
jgi:LysM repeat protein